MSKRTNRESYKRVSDYAELLRLPQWQRRRTQVLNHADFRCQICGRDDEMLHVHHSYYRRGKKPWEYPLGSMIAVCETHHEMIHEARKAPAAPLVATVTETVSVAVELPGLDPGAPASPTAARAFFQQMRDKLNQSSQAA